MTVLRGTSLRQVTADFCAEMKNRIFVCKRLRENNNSRMPFCMLNTKFVSLYTHSELLTRYIEKQKIIPYINVNFYRTFVDFDEKYRFENLIIIYMYDIMNYQIYSFSSVQRINL